MRYLVRILFILNIIIVIGLWTTGFLSGLNPEKWGWFSLMGYAFPFFIIATILFIVAWIFIRKRCILISFVGLLIAYFPVTLYCPVNLRHAVTNSSHLNTKEAQETLKLMSYNVYNWGLGYGDVDNYEDIGFTDEEKKLVMVDFFKSVNADIVAIQESQIWNFPDTLTNIYHYSDTLHSFETSECAIHLLSKYPITRKENFNFSAKGNGGGAFWINYKGHEIIVIAVHLQSMGFSMDEKLRFSSMVHGGNENTGSMRNTSKTVFGKILLAAKKRAGQADKIARFIDSHISNSSNHSTPIIVMGDFNDIPQSYTHARICDMLTDCYRECGFGPGFSYKHFGMRVRIDNILCSNDFTPLSCYIDKNIEISDHLPIIATLKLSETP